MNKKVKFEDKKVPKEEIDDEFLKEELPEGKGFRLTSKRVMLTYKTHIPKEYLTGFLQDKANKDRPFKFILLAHELGDKTNNYEHTHVLLDFGEKTDIKTSRVFDFYYEVFDEEEEEDTAYMHDEKGVFIGEKNPLHPHIKPVRPGENNFKKCINYLCKEDAENEDFMVEINDKSGISMDEVHDAPTLYDALKNANLHLTRANDIKLVYETREVESNIALYSKDMFIVELPEIFRNIFLHGGSGIGKTQLALAQFKNPLLVRHLDNLKNFSPKFHDGIVFDDINLKYHGREQCIAITDWDMPSDINVKHSVARIPANTRKIFTSNIMFDEYFPEDEASAIKRRFSFIIKLGDNKLFKEEEKNAIKTGTLDFDTIVTKDGKKHLNKLKAEKKVKDEADAKAKADAKEKCGCDEPAKVAPPPIKEIKKNRIQIVNDDTLKG